MSPHPIDPAGAGRTGDPTPRETPRRFRAAFDRSVQFLALLSPDGTVLEANRTALGLIGAEREDVVGRRFWETRWWNGDETRERLRAAIAAAAAGETVRYGIEHIAAGGSATVVDFSLTPVPGAGGRIEFLLAEGRDVTEAERAREALRVSEAKFSGIVSISADAIISVDESQRIIHFNYGAEKIFGYGEREVLGRPLDILIPEAARAAHREHVRQFGESPAFARHMGERGEISGRRKNGELFPAEASISKLDLGGSRIYTVVLRDITERKRVERAQRFLADAGAVLAASLDYEETLESIVRLAVPALADWCMVYIAERDGIRRLRAAHADPAREPLLRRLESFPIDDRSPHPLLRALGSGEAECIPEAAGAFLDSFAPDPEYRAALRELGLASALIVPLAARGDNRGAIGLYRSHASPRYAAADLDLARGLAARAALAMDNARLYREAQQAIRARDDVLAVVSHDLGNPLGAIRIGTTLLLRHLPREELGTAGWKHLEGIRQSVEQMERLVHNLLEVKRLEAGHLSLERRSHRAASLVAAAVEALAPVAGERSIALDARVDDGVPPVLADRDRVQQVFSNLIGNAIKFTPEGGRITVEAAPDGAEVRFAVADTGIGIAPESLARVFDRFWQARRPRPEGRGIGLGLAIVKGIVEAHGGRVWVESQEGVGTTFYFTLPVADAGGAR